MKGLRGKVIVVTGGTKGLGRAVVQECARRGARVVIGGRDEGVARKMLDGITASGSEGIFVGTDLRNLADCQSLFDRAMECFGKVDGFFSYAGVTYAASLLEFDEDHYNTIFDINTRATLFCCQYALRCMVKNGGGSIVLTGTPHAWGGEKDRVVYACSKGALLTLTKHIAQHYADCGVRANLLTMGWTPTDGEMELRTEQGISLDELSAIASGVIPAGRMTQLEDLVPGVVYLLSDDSKMVSGSNLRITGGWYL